MDSRCSYLKAFVINAFLGQLCLADTSKFNAYSPWIDADSPTRAWKTTSMNDTEFRLVFSDEFEKDGRNFADGFDYKWTAVDRPDTVNEPLQYYRPDMITTNNGFLNITTWNKPVSWSGWNEQLKKWDSFTRYYQSGMVQGWNKFCFTGGIVELSVQLPGPGNQPGLWPAAWMMGNLGRATWEPTTHGVWPYSFDSCLHETATDNLDPQYADGQRISACDANPGKGLKQNQGRGAPEIDIFEAMAGPNWAMESHSLQIAPPLPGQLRPIAPFWPGPGEWYDGLKFGFGTQLNTAYYGATGVDAISGNSAISQDDHKKQSVLRIEWQPGSEGYIRWFKDGKFQYEIPASAVTKTYAGLPGRLIPEEPMYLILNTAMSNTWSALCFDPYGSAAGTRCPPGSKDPCCLFPAHYLIDYVRVYQKEDDKSHTIGCDPQSHPTKEYIEANEDLYAPLLTPVALPFSRLEEYGISIFKQTIVSLCLIFMSIAVGLFCYLKCRKRASYNSIS